MDKISDAELMRWTAAGDFAAAGEIVRRHHRLGGAAVDCSIGEKSVFI